MSKITFRADDDLVEQLEGLEISKSEAMREALRSYLEDGDMAQSGASGSDTERDDEGVIDELVRERVDERIATRLRELGLDGARSRAHGSSPARDPQDVNVTISLEGATTQSEEQVRVDSGHARETSDGHQGPRQSQGPADAASEGGVQCNQCGDHMNGDHVYCPNCGEKASRRLFCDCGDEIRSDWSFCPGCGRRTPAADVLESNGSQY
ncbi:double zinc ribbon domain-containing protein [Natrinema salsiterrestre]|uniref:Ribbon-helix-helix protein, CopG family n=1 Tax=Natrinema salsiterrestre TaxID=2950540 RepID=A0A9Q4L2W9_9EURY|nr:zinc ribbon domain-containing protein [Natrinema salsiterrestre]MDF9744356.1 ribbon-helix-helix protein, CopG family [Natrinema salsiterrestre]